MSKNTKIVVGIVVGVLVVCCLGAGIVVTILPRVAKNFADEAVIENPTQAAEVASSMLDYELPPSFTEAGGMNFFGIKTVFIESKTEDSAIMLMQFPAEMAGNENQMQQQLEDAFSQQRGSQNLELSYVGSESVTINDAPATLAIYEGTDDLGRNIRQIIGVFETKDGNTGMLMLFGFTADWEKIGMETFLNSLK